MSLVLDGLALAVTAGLAWWGWRRGARRTAFSLLALLLAYAAGALFHRPAGELLGRIFSLQPLVSYPLGGATVALAVLVAAMLVRGLLGRKRDKEQRKERDRAASGVGRTAREAPEALPRSSRLAGAVLGGGYGAALMVLMVGLTQLWAATRPGLEVGSSLAARLALPAWQALARTLVGRTSHSDVLAEAAARFIARPAETAKSLETVFGDERVQALLRDPQVTRAASGEAPAGKAKDALQSLAGDAAFVEAARRAGFLEGGVGVGSPEETARRLAAGFAPVGRTVQALANDEELKGLLEDPSLAEAIARQDMARLANDPKFNQVAGIVLSHLRGQRKQAPPAGASQPARPAAGAPASRDLGARPNRPIYRWTDERGVIHLSHEAPPEGIEPERITPRSEK